MEVRPAYAHIPAYLVDISVGGRVVVYRLAKLSKLLETWNGRCVVLGNFWSAQAYKEYPQGKLHKFPGETVLYAEMPDYAPDSANEGLLVGDCYRLVYWKKH